MSIREIIAAICIFIGLFVFLCSILGIYRFDCEGRASDKQRL